MSEYRRDTTNLHLGLGLIYNYNDIKPRGSSLTGLNVEEIWYCINFFQTT